MRLACGPFSIDFDTRQILRGEEEVHLSPKAFDLLVTLVEARPKALAKARLVEALWPDTFVTEGNLSVLVAEIRRALGDDARSPRYVRTVSRFGYSFVGPVDPDSGRMARQEGGDGHWLVWGRRRIELEETESVIGRDPHCQIHLDVPGVSRHHARLTITADEVVLEDLGSKNGTLMDGRPISGSVSLRDLDRFQIGPVELTYRFWRDAASTATWVAPQSLSGRAKRSS